MDTVPPQLRESTTAANLFVCRNPCYLDMPLKMTGQPNIYKMPKELMLGARPLLKKPSYTWWPPKEFRSLVIGQFDIYPNQFNEVDLGQMLHKKAAEDPTPSFEKLAGDGCYLVSEFLTIQEQ